MRQLGPVVGSLGIRTAFAESVSLGFNLFERDAPEAALDEAVTLFQSVMKLIQGEEVSA